MVGGVWLSRQETEVTKKQGRNQPSYLFPGIQAIGTAELPLQITGMDMFLHSLDTSAEGSW